MFHRLLNNAYPIHITAPSQHPQQAFPALSATNTPASLHYEYTYD